MTLSQAAERVGMTASTLRRWIRAGLVPQYDGTWTPEVFAARRRDAG